MQYSSRVRSIKCYACGFTVMYVTVTHKVHACKLAQCIHDHCLAVMKAEVTYATDSWLAFV